MAYRYDQVYGPTKNENKVASGAVVNDTLNIMAEREKLDAYNKAKELAAEREKALSNVKDRTSLANYYQAYTEDLNRAAANNDLTTYYRDKIITNSISKRLKDTSTPLTAIQDLGLEAKTSVAGIVANFSDTLAYTGISATSLNPNVLRRIATKEEGTLKETIENYGWGKNNWHDLVMLTQKYPEDEVIANLYDTVSKQGYKGDPEYFNNVVNYINNLNNQERFERWQQQHTIDEQRARELLDVEESLSYNPIGKFLLDSVGVASYMAPSLALGAGVGAATGLTAAQGAVSLGFMGLSAAGNATSSVLQEGYDWNRAGAYGAVVGLTEVATELIGGEFMNSLIFGKSVATPVGKAMQKFFENNNITNFGVRAALMGLADVNAEGIEEVISEALDPVYKSIILNDYSGFENYGENLFKAYYESILPTLILGGFSAAQINMSVDKQVKAIENSINKNTQFTPEQKAKMISEIENAASDARIGLGEHYEELKAELVKNLKEKAKDDARARSLYAMQAGMSGLTDQEKSDVFNSFIKQKGLQWNPGTGTVQELLDTNESANLTYKNQTDIDIDAGRIMGSNSNITDIYPVETTNKAKANIINMATKIAQKLGKEQVVLADIKTNNGSMVMGATNVESKNIFINANLNIKDTLAATFHELGHVIAEKHPNVFKAFKKAMEVKYGTKLENILREYNNVVGTYDNLGETLTEGQINYLAEELLGDYAGETMSKQENEKKVEKSTRDLWTNLKDLGNAIQSRYDSNTQRDNTKVSEYNLSGLSYLDMGLLNDTSLENMLFDAMKGKDQVKEATKKTEEIVKKGLRKAEPKTETKTEKTQETKKEEKKPEGVNSKIEQRYAEMKDTAKTPEIMRMIAEQTGLEYNPLVPVSQRGDNARIQAILTQLRNDGKIQETGTKLSTRKGEGSNEFRKLQEESRRELNTKSWKERSEQNDEDLRQRLSRTFKEELRYRGYSDSNNNGILKFSAKGNNFDMYENVDGQTFHDIFEIVRAYTENGELVDLHSVKEDEHGVGYEDTKNYLSTDGMQGFAITKDGDLISVFNADLGKRGFLRSIESFIKKNAKTLDCYMSPLQDLQKIYSSIFGFKTASIMDFNMEYDHDDIAKNHNKPKVAFMVNTEADVETKHFNKDQYDEAQAYQLSYTKNSKQSSFSMRKTDNNGRPLTNAQIDYFKDSVVRDSEGRLLEVYHGSRGNKFFTFNPRRGLNIDGAYFASNINTAGHWSKGYYRMIDEARYKDYTDKIEKAKTIKDVLKIIKDAHLGVELELNATFNDEKKGDYYRLEEKWGNDDEPSSSGPFGYSKDGGKTFDIENALGRIKDEALDIVNSAYYGGDKHFVYLNITKPLIVDANKKPYWQIEFEGKKVNTETIASIAKERGYDGVIIRDVLETDYENSLTDDYIIFNSEQAKLIDNKNPTKNPDTRFSQRKEDPNIRRLEKATNNLRNEMAKQEDKIEEQKNEIKRLENTGKAMEDTYKRVIRGYIKEINNQLRTGRNTELKLRDKNNKLSTAYKLKIFEGQFNRKANLLGLNMGKEFRDLFVGLRDIGDTIDEAWSTTLLIYTEANRFNTAIKNSLNILNEVRQRKVYNKLPQELKDKIDAYNKFYTKGAEQTDLTFAKRLLNDATIREHLGKIAVTNSVKNQLIENEKNTVSLKEYLDSIEAAEKFEVGLEQLREEIKEFQQRNMEAERAKELKPVRNEILDSVATELGVKEKQSLNKFKKNLTNRTMFNSQMTFKTETQALMGGNINTPMMALEKNLQNGEIRKKQAIVDMYSFLNKFLTSTAYKIRGIDKWKAELEKSLSNKSDWVDTGVEVRGKNLRLPRSMIMSLAMHLQNDQNMSHISGAITRVVTDDKGKTTIEFKDGEGVRVPNENLYKKGKIDEAFDRGRTIKLSYEDVQDIVSMLTEEEQAFVDATRKVLNYTSKLINEVSNRIYGYDIATVENYFPIHVWRKGVHKDVLQNSKLDKTGKVDALTYLTSAGWLQDRTTSFAPIYLENMAEVLDRVMNNVATYYGYAEALRDNQIILNSAYKEPISFGDDYEADTLEEAIGYLSSSYLENYRRLTRFIVGAESQKYGKLRGLMAMNTLTFNLGTWLTQPMSFFNTLKYYTGKNFLSGVNPINNHIRLDNKIREYYKDLGIDTGDMNDYELARSFIAMATPNLDYRTLGYKKPELKQLYGKRLTDNIDVHGIEAFDNIAVTAIARMMAWNLSQEPGLEFGSEEYFKRLGAELTQVLVETQPEFSQINRANMFRSANPFMRMLNLFGTPANQMFNNMAQSLLELRYQAREGNSEGFKRAVLNAVKSLTGVIVSATMVGLVRALRDSVRYGDDDDTEFADRWIAQGIIAGLGPTLILDDMAQLLMANAKFGGMNSYDFNTPETTYINGVLNLLDKSAQLFNEDVSGAKKATDIIRAFGTVTPVDTKSLVRVYTALMKVVAPDAYKSYKLQTDSTIYKQWLKHSDTDMATFYKAYTATRPKVLESKYGYHKADKEKNIESNLKESREKALNDVLDNSNDVKKYMGILFNYKD